MRACRRERKREAVTCARALSAICKGVKETRIGIRGSRETRRSPSRINALAIKNPT